MNLPAAYIPPDKLEIFCREYIMTGNDLVAAMRSGIRFGDDSLRKVAYTLRQRPDVNSAIREMRKQLKGIAPNIEITKLSIAEDLQDVFDQAYIEKDWRSCIAAKDSQAKVLGFLINKVEVSAPDDPEKMTTAQLEAFLKQMATEGESERIIDVGSEDSDEESSISSPS